MQLCITFLNTAVIDIDITIIRDIFSARNWVDQGSVDGPKALESKSSESKPSNVSTLPPVVPPVQDLIEASL